MGSDLTVLRLCSTGTMASICHSLGAMLSTSHRPPTLMPSFISCLLMPLCTPCSLRCASCDEARVYDMARMCFGSLKPSATPGSCNGPEGFGKLPEQLHHHTD